MCNREVACWLGGVWVGWEVKVLGVMFEWRVEEVKEAVRVAREHRPRGEAALGVDGRSRRAWGCWAHEWVGWSLPASPGLALPASRRESHLSSGRCSNRQASDRRAPGSRASLARSNP